MKILCVIMLCCFVGSTVPPGPPPSISTLTEDESLQQGRFSSSTEPPPEASTPFTSGQKTTKQASAKLKDTTVVIIVSVSLALLVCAVIPFIFFGSCRSNKGDQIKPELKKDEAVYLKEKERVPSTQAAVTLQSLDPERCPQDAPQNTSINQALHPKSLH